MMVLTRIASKALLWFVVVFTVFACCEVAAWSPNARLLSDAAKPLPALPAEQRGLTVEEVVQWFNRTGLDDVSPLDVVE